MIVNTKTGEIYDRPPRQYWDTRQIAKSKKRLQVTRDLNVALATYSVGATVVIALLV